MFCDVMSGSWVLAEGSYRVARMVACVEVWEREREVACYGS